MSRISKKKLLEKYHRRFANGEQYLKLDLQNKTIVETDKDYYWQKRAVYNHILPIIKSIAKDLDDNLIYGENGLVSLLIPYQRAYNAIKNREMEYIERQSMGILCVEDGSVDVDELCEEGIYGGKIIIYRQGSSAPKLEMGNLDTTSYIESSKNVLNEMYTLAESFCQRCLSLQKNKLMSSRISSWI